MGVLEYILVDNVVLKTMWFRIRGQELMQFSGTFLWEGNSFEKLHKPLSLDQIIRVHVKAKLTCLFLLLQHTASPDETTEA